MLSCVMGGKSIPCLEGSLTDDAEVGHVQVDLCVSFSGLFSHKRLVAAEAEESSIMSSRYHLIHKRIQVRCEQEHQISDPFRKTTPASLLHSCQSTSIYLFMFILHNRADQPELLHDQVISWTKKNVLGSHELWHSEWKEHSWFHTPWCTGCKAASYPSEFPRAF